MKKITNFSLTLLLFTVFWCDNLMAQNAFTDGSISYKVIRVDGPEYLKSLMRGSRSTYHVKGQLSSFQSTMMNGMMKSSVITNHETDSSYMLNDMLGDQTAILLDVPEQESAFEITYYPKVTKEILGYTCHKALVKFKGGAVTLFVTEEITAPNQLTRQYTGLKGFPLVYDMTQNGVTLTFQASAISHLVPDAALFLIPDAYKRMSLEAYERMMKEKHGMR